MTECRDRMLRDQPMEKLKIRFIQYTIERYKAEYLPKDQEVVCEVFRVKYPYYIYTPRRAPDTGSVLLTLQWEMDGAMQSLWSEVK